eukprot:9085555-Heterocapsa_arctica.AAC.1
MAALPPGRTDWPTRPVRPVRSALRTRPDHVATAPYQRGPVRRLRRSAHRLRGVDGSSCRGDTLPRDVHPRAGRQRLVRPGAEHRLGGQEEGCA